LNEIKIKMEKKYYILIIAVILILLLVTYSVYSADESYRLVCENAKSIKEYTSCIKLDYIINR